MRKMQILLLILLYFLISSGSIALLVFAMNSITKNELIIVIPTKG